MTFEEVREVCEVDASSTASLDCDYLKQEGLSDSDIQKVTTHALLRWSTRMTRLPGQVMPARRLG